MDVVPPETILSPIFPVPTDKSIVKECSNDLKYNQLSGKKIHGFYIEKVLGEGGFGIVYKCHATTKKGNIVSGAFKSEMNLNHNAPSVGLLFECKILQKLEEAENNVNFVSLYGCGSRKNFTFMIMSLLGPNLYDICCYLPGEKFEFSTWIRVVYQMLQSIKSLHSIGYIHNDLKPSNFTIGDKDIENGSVIIYLIDFGLSRLYGTKDFPKPPVFNGEKKALEYIGTITHCSPNAHKRTELGRRDDMFSWMFLMMDFYNELPWRRCETDEQIEECKMNCNYDTYSKYLPKSCAPIIKHIINLTTYEEPKYDQLFDKLKKIMKENKIKMDDYYQWELLPAEAKKILNLKIDLRKIKKCKEKEKVTKLSGRNSSKRGRNDKNSTRKSHSKRKDIKICSGNNQNNKSDKNIPSKKLPPGVCDKGLIEVEATNFSQRGDATQFSKHNPINTVVNNVVNNFSCLMGYKGNKKAKTHATIDNAQEKALTEEFYRVGNQNIEEKIEKKIKTVESKRNMP
ncbi:Protein kinase domain and Serine/threonine-/dual specificity protein kinase, catalytic domain and Protein kinase-like domain-containing protein [Strongyloides ratti]|uniref:non-specific serine/threonine protein kinase n=1 Tax=Strongyloides ratti TaxID=34506 RepID=A0A090LPR4_STRRB|nr:Protein kinase domain and Serine/threonine-/dual specificity protein kinase, catalytic domain and Protein kinase-like domain-containing protein [Strongyloides ratti]CEF69540.1 Protein kinase domain and Serine/threonine-/dual specificity protein kinase, catalytic domain and Protein kinase-like domain-containing protein [Strongyloides ratti]